MRSLFGLNTASGKRMVAGTDESLDSQDLEYVKESNIRLALLHDLYNRYKGTSHELKFKTVYDKTKQIHTYLVSQKRVHELEVFHLQNTEHFINTFTSILNVHRHTEHSSKPLEEEEKAPLQKQKSFLEEMVVEAEKKVKVASKANAKKNGSNSLSYTAEAQLVEFALPEISIDTFSKVYYVKGYTSNGLLSGEISFTSTDKEKEAFLLHISERLGLGKNDLSYLGNTMITLPESGGSSSQSGYVPVIHWKGFIYALHIKDYRLFPVQLLRRRF